MLRIVHSGQGFCTAEFFIGTKSYLEVSPVKQVGAELLWLERNWGAQGPSPNCCPQQLLWGQLWRAQVLSKHMVWSGSCNRSLLPGSLCSSPSFVGLLQGHLYLTPPSRASSCPLWVELVFSSWEGPWQPLIFAKLHSNHYQFPKIFHHPKKKPVPISCCSPFPSPSISTCQALIYFPPL